MSLYTQIGITNTLNFVHPLRDFFLLLQGVEGVGFLAKRPFNGGRLCFQLTLYKHILAL